MKVKEERKVACQKERRPRVKGVEQSSEKIRHQKKGKQGV